MPIYLASSRENYVIRQVSGADTIKTHLENLGCIVGESIMLVSRNNDNIIIKIKGVSLAISKELSKRILV